VSQTATHIMDGGATHVQPVEVVVIDGDDRGRSATATGGAIKIGTSPGNALRLTDPTVSRIHCEISPIPGGARVVDEGSTNGTWVDGHRARDVDVGSGATIRVGATTLRVMIGDDALEIPLSSREGFGEVVGSSVAMRRIYALIERAGPTNATVLLQGETGTGKELVARAIHDASKRASGPFIAIDCGAIAPTLIESELFGHVRGAFSGAVGDRKGLFEEAHGGTLFLDEIGELPMALQAKLLRVLETFEVRRVGSNSARKVDVRLVAATNRPLAPSVNEGVFREELYYRLAVVEIVLPPLRARREDIPALAAHFGARFAGAGTTLSPDFVSSLMTRSWPGNVRELRNYIERQITLGTANEAIPSSRKSAPRALPSGVEAFVPVDMPMKQAREAWLAEFDGAYARALLKRTNGNVTRAAEIADVSRRFLQRLMLKLGMRVEGEAAEDDD
jgi:DNA-binding NtrC family response regulator